MGRRHQAAARRRARGRQADRAGERVHVGQGPGGRRGGVAEMSYGYIIARELGHLKDGEQLAAVAIPSYVKKKRSAEHPPLYLAFTRTELNQLRTNVNKAIKLLAKRPR